MSIYHYYYDIKICSNAYIYNSPTIKKHFKNANEIIIASKIFDSYEECEKTFSDLLEMLIVVETQLSSKQYCIATKSNPLLQDVEDESWDKHIVLKAFVIEVNDTPQNLIYNVYGEIKISSEQVALINSLTPHTIQ